MYTFPENLKRIRKEKGITQKVLAGMIGVTQTSISYYEQSLEYPTIDRVYDIARALNVRIEALVCDDNQLKENKNKIYL